MYRSESGKVLAIILNVVYGEWEYTVLSGSVQVLGREGSRFYKLY